MQCLTVISKPCCAIPIEIFNCLKMISCLLEQSFRKVRFTFPISRTLCKTGAFKGAKLECAAGKIGSMVETLKKHNAQNRGIYFVINYGGHEDADITRINAQFVECDTLSLNEQFAQIAAFPLPPSMIVRTQKSLHCYWLMKDAKVEDFRRVQKRLVAQFGGDPACINESRVFRLPGFYHCKGEPVMVECVKFNPELRYTQAELETCLPMVSDEPVVKAPSPKGTRKGLTLVGKRCLFIQHCKDNARTLSEHDWYAMISNLAVFEGGESTIHALSKEYPKYRRSETQDKINHFLESGTKPMTCLKIAEVGFKCPKLEDGSCGCKSPAALCYKALNVDELREYLNVCEIKGATLDNIQAAKGFVADYLYNIEPVIGETFINYEMKSYFRFKAADLKPLLSLHREIYKKYADSRDTRREKEGSELSDWYEMTERGGLRFLPGILANHMAKNVHAFYGAGSYFFYQNGVYNAQEDLAAQAKVREFLIPRYATMNAIIDAVGQWRMQIRKAVREINSNPFIINVRNGLYNVLDGSFKLALAY